jgi:hypothetical protein
MDMIGLDVLLDIEEHYAAVREGFRKDRGVSCANTPRRAGLARKPDAAFTMITAPPDETEDAPADLMI